MRKRLLGFDESRSLKITAAEKIERFVETRIEADRLFEGHDRLFRSATCIQAKAETELGFPAAGIKVNRPAVIHDRSGQVVGLATGRGKVAEDCQIAVSGRRGPLQQADREFTPSSLPGDRAGKIKRGGVTRHVI